MYFSRRTSISLPKKFLRKNTNGTASRTHTSIWSAQHKNSPNSTSRCAGDFIAIEDKDSRYVAMDLRTLWDALVGRDNLPIENDDAVIFAPKTLFLRSCGKSRLSLGRLIPRMMPRTHERSHACPHTKFALATRYSHKAKLVCGLDYFSQC